MICQLIMSNLKQDFLKQRTTLQQKTVPVNSHLVDTLIIRTLAKSQAKINCWHLTEINSCYYVPLLMRTLTHVPTVREIADCTCSFGIHFTVLTLYSMTTWSLTAKSSIFLYHSTRRLCLGIFCSTGWQWKM